MIKSRYCVFFLIFKSINNVSIFERVVLKGDICRGKICGYFGRLSVAAFQQFFKSWPVRASRCARDQC